MASEDLTRALAAVLEGRGLQVQNWDSGPAGGKPPPPARLRANVSYVVLAVFLNEKVEFSKLPRRQTLSPCKLAGSHAPPWPRHYVPMTLCTS